MKLHVWRLLLPGFLLLCIAIALRDRNIEFGLGRAAGSLLWGPMLFRTLLAVHGLVLMAVGLVRLLAQPAAAADNVARKDFPWGTLACLTVAGAVLRFWRLDSCLWLDEILTLVDFARPPLSHIVTSF